MGKIRFDTLDTRSPALLEACVTLVANAFADPKRYSAERIGREFQHDDSVFYRRFFVATKGRHLMVRRF